MSDVSAVLGLPYIQPSQAQKHVTHNEAIQVLDALVQLSVEARDVTLPPAVPVQGARYILPAGVSGAWAGRGGNLAVWSGTEWAYHTPALGWLAHIRAEGIVAVFDGTGWSSITGLAADDLQNLPGVGINTGSNAVNRLAVSSEATLLTHAGNDHRLKVNKSAATDTASLLFQSGFTGHAEMGLAGSNAFSVRVSNDGSSFTDAFSANATSGTVSFPAGLDFGNQTLSHYETGTWTPNLRFGGADAGVSYGVQQGRFARIGDLVALYCAVDLTSKGSAAGVADIAGLPFAVTPFSSSGDFFFESGGFGLNAPKCRISPSGTIGLFNSTPSGAIDLDDTNFTDLASFEFSMTYLTS